MVDCIARPRCRVGRPSSHPPCQPPANAHGSGFLRGSRARATPRDHGGSSGWDIRCTRPVHGRYHAPRGPTRQATIVKMQRALCRNTQGALHKYNRHPPPPLPLHVAHGARVGVEGRAVRDERLHLRRERLAVLGEPLNFRREPLAVQVEPLHFRREPLAVQVEPLHFRREPLSVQVEPLYFRREPLSVQVEPLYFRREPLSVQVEPLYFRRKPLSLQVEPLHLRREPLSVQVEPLYFRREPLLALVEPLYFRSEPPAAQAEPRPLRTPPPRQARSWPPWSRSPGSPHHCSPSTRPHPRW